MTLNERLSPPLKAQLGMVKQAAIEIWNAPQHRHYTDHKPDSHSERIIEKLNAMDASMETPLREAEAFILLSAAYLHDIGMQMRPSADMTLDEVRDQHHVLSRKMIEGSITDPNRFRSVGLMRTFVDEVALVSEAHRKINLASPEFKTRLKAGQDVRLQLLSAMLRLGDALDLDERRVIMDNLRLEEVSPISRLHWWRCHYVEGVAIREGTIQVSCAVPSEDYAYYIRASLQNEVRAEVEKVRPFLWPDVKLAVGDVTARVSATGYPMSTSDFDALRAQVRHEMEDASRAANEQITDMRSREERAAQEAAAEGRRLSGSDPPGALELLKQAARLFQRLGQLHAVAAQLELIGQIHKEREEWTEFSELHEQLGHLYLLLEEPFRAKWAFIEAQEKAPVDESWKDQELHLWRGLHAARAQMLWGEFEGLQKYLDEVRAVLAGKSSPVVSLWYEVQIDLHTLQNEWKEACEQAQQLIADLEATASSNQREANLADACYEMSIIASLAGKHHLANEWIERTFRYHDSHRMQSQNIPRENLFPLHARRGVLRWRAGRRGTAMKDFFEAVRWGEEVGADVNTLIQLENAMVVARQKMVPLHPFLKARNSKMHDLQLSVGEMRGLPTDGGDDRLADNYSTALIALHKALNRNDLRGLARAQLALARINERSKRPYEALSLLVTAGVGNSEDINRGVATLLEQSEVQASEGFHKLFERAGATEAELASLGTIVTQAGDFVPDGDVEALVNRSLEKIESPRASEGVVCALLPAIEELAPRLLDDFAHRVALLCIKLLKESQAHRHTVLEATAKVVCALATDVPLGKSCVTRLTLDTRVQLADCLTPLIERDNVGKEALIALLEVGFPRGEYANVSEGEKALRAQTKHFLENLAIEKRQLVPLQIYVGAEIGPIPNELAPKVFLHFSRQADEELEMAQTGQFNLSAHTTTLHGLKSFARLLQPGVLSQSEATHLFERILELAEHRDNMISRREVAIHMLGLLAEPLSKLQEAGDMPDDFLSRTATTAENLFRNPNLGVMQQYMAQGAKDPLNRFKMNTGEVTSLQSTALRALGCLAPHLPKNKKHNIFVTLNDGISHVDAIVRNGATYALRQAHPALDTDQRDEALMQLYALLHDGDPDLRSTALFVLDRYGGDIQSPIAHLFFHRVMTLCFAPQQQIRSHAIHLLQRWVATPAFISKKGVVVDRLKEMQTDVSFVVRRASIICLEKLEAKAEY